MSLGILSVKSEDFDFTPYNSLCMRSIMQGVSTKCIKRGHYIGACNHYDLSFHFYISKLILTNILICSLRFYFLPELFSAIN